MGQKQPMKYTDYFPEVMNLMTTHGILLCAWSKPGILANAMTIGWGLIGSVWSRPCWQVMVRPSRYTFELLKEQSIFTVNVLAKSQTKALAICGSKSGRDLDKLAECGLSVTPGTVSGGPVIDQSIIHYECHIVHSNDFIPEAMIPDIRKGAYPSGDYHRVFWGEILESQVDPEGLPHLS